MTTEFSLNLLPASVSRARRSSRALRRRFLLIGLLVVAAIAVVILFDMRVQRLRDEAARLDQRIAAAAPSAAKTRQIDAEMEALRVREGALGRITTGLPRWSGFVANLSGVVPADTWLTNLTISNAGVEIKGQSFSEASVSAMATRLSDNGLVSKMTLTFSGGDDSGGRRVFAFTITGVPRPGGAGL